MKQAFYLFLLIIISCSADEKAIPAEYAAQAKRVTIIRDHWGIPHIYGKTDADAVFGLMYAQCEDSFEKVERNYIDKLGRLSEIEGKAYLYQDLQTRLINDTAAAIADYEASPEWLKKLLQAFSDGIHYYLAVHPEVKPKLITRFEPWYPLLFTDGAYIDVQTGGLQTADMKAMYGQHLPAIAAVNTSNPVTENSSKGSNGFAIGPPRSATKNALLYINPHVSFYFRTEVHLASEEGLNAYGAATWGQFFVFQGFNESCGWMHTSTMADASDLYEEKITKKGEEYFYEYDGQSKPVTKKQVSIKYLESGNLASSSLTTYATHHGPVMGMRNNKWLALKAQNRSLQGLIQSWQRTKAKNLAQFTETMQMKSNGSTNTLYADNNGNIAYWHGNFIPKRDSSLDVTMPLDGSSSKTDWKGAHDLSELVHVINPKEGWLQNCNSSPFGAAGLGSIANIGYPSYMAPEGENFRSLYAIKKLSNANNVTLEKLAEIGYDRYLSAFDTLLPALFRDYNALPPNDSYRNSLEEVIDSLRNWDRRSSVTSAATTIAVFWAYSILSTVLPDVPVDFNNDHVKMVSWYARNTSPEQKFRALQELIGGLEQSVGTWKVKWGDINRFQRTGNSISPVFDSKANSFSVGFGPAFLGSLPSYETTWHEGKMYGVAGNSFVAVVEFGKRITAKTLSTGGQSFAPNSKNFIDQAQMYIDGKFKEVFFYKEDVEKNAERTYHPGEL